jgi:hypothetical protein
MFAVAYLQRLLYVRLIDTWVFSHPFAVSYPHFLRFRTYRSQTERERIISHNSRFLIVHNLEKVAVKMFKIYQGHSSHII